MKDGDVTNNTAANLRWATHQENMANTVHIAKKSRPVMRLFMGSDVLVRYKSGNDTAPQESVSPMINTKTKNVPNIFGC